MNKKKDKDKLPVWIYVIFIVGLCIVCIAGWYIYSYVSNIMHSQSLFKETKELVDNSHIDEQMKKIEEMQGSTHSDNTPTPTPLPTEIPEITHIPTITPIPTPIDYSELLKKNKDVIGWIKVPDTKIDYPVMQTPNNEQYYLERDVNGNFSYSGCLFCNANANIEEPSDNITIHGHHMKAGTMFQNLDYYKKESWYKNHKYFIFNTVYRTGIYEVVGVYLTDSNYGSYPYWNLASLTETEFNEYIDFIRSHQVFKISTLDSVHYGDKLVSLSTCAYHTTNGKLVVVGKLIDTDDTNLLK